MQPVAVPVSLHTEMIVYRYAFVRGNEISSPSVTFCLFSCFFSRRYRQMQRLVISLNFISHCPKWESHRTDQTVDLRCCRGQERIYLSFVRLTQESTVASQLFFTVDQPFNCFGDIIISRKNRRVQKTKQKSNRFRAFPSFEHKTMAFGCCLRAKTSIEIIDLDFVSFSVFFSYFFLFRLSLHRNFISSDDWTRTGETQKCMFQCFFFLIRLLRKRYTRSIRSDRLRQLETFEL